mgnify:CR=1 FL=1
MINNIMNISIKPEPFDNIKNGRKTIEVRLYRKLFEEIKVNDNITFYSKNGSILKNVKNIKLYNSFEHLYNSENINLITPHLKSKEDFIYHYKNIYKNIDKNKFKVVALFI